MIFGAHMPTSGGVWKAFQRGIDLGCEIIQVFVKNNMQWKGRALTAAELKLYRDARKEASSIRCVFGHAGYLINLGAAPSPNRDNSIASLLLEVQLATSLELPFLVLHPGSHLGSGVDEGLTRVAEGLDEVFAATKASAVRIALENTAGQGTCLGADLQHFVRIYEKVKCPERLAVCLDTAHLFAGGCDIRKKAIWDRTLKDLDHLLGLKELVAVHLNDCKSDLGSRLDRHAAIGGGKIGAAAFRHIINDPRLKRVPGCLETPKSPDLHEDRENLAKFRSLLRK